jgi:SAM-dependent methyltransferase
VTLSARVDDVGIELSQRLDAPLDVRFDGHRLWSFNAARDASSTQGKVLVAWPRAIKQGLSGVAQVRVEGHLDGFVWFEGEVAFGTSAEPLRFVDDTGQPLTLDKGGRLQRTFDRMDSASLTELVSASRRVLDDLVDVCGLDAYLCYGGLLGAVRNGKMIGHDSDVDLAWVSKYTHPFDIIRESRKAEQQMRERGWRVVRMSAANFKVWAPLPNGKRAGVDVFGSFWIGDHFHITGSLRGRLEREELLPFGTIELEGVEFPAPRDLDAFLAYTYGPGWKVPDPAFHFDHPPENTQMMSQWWRGSRLRLWHWSAFYESPRAAEVPDEPSLFAQWVAERIEPEAQVVELGSGTGRDAAWLAEQGFQVVASDYCGAARNLTSNRVKAQGLTLPIKGYNLEAPYNFLGQGAKLAHQPGAKHVYARGLIDALAPSGRDGLWRFCSMVCRSGGHAFLEFRTAASKGEPTYFGPHVRTYARVPVIEAEIARHGGTVVTKTVGRNLAPLGTENPIVCRLEVSWT